MRGQQSLLICLPIKRAKTMNKILVIDDEAAIVNGLIKMLTSWGYQAKASLSGLNGIGYLQSEKFDLVITDMRMPDINGIDLIKRIKLISPGIKIIILSGSLAELNTSEIEALNIFKLLEKPISQRELKAVVHEALGIYEFKKSDKIEKIKTESVELTTDKKKKGFSKGDILVVDDNEDLANSIKSLLSFKNYNVTTASDGKEALEKIKSQKFDLILMDIRMPNMNGIEAVKKIKDINPELFIVMMTGEAGDEEVEKALHEGGYAILRKPFSPDKLLKSISWFREADEDIKLKKEHHEAIKKAGAWHRLKHRARKNMENYRMNILTVSLIALSIIIGISLVFYIENLRSSLLRSYTDLSASYTNYMDKVVGYLERDERRELKRK